MSIDWTKIEFEAYVLLYAAQCNLLETEEEREYILSKVDEKTFNKVHTQIVFDKEEDIIENIKEYLLTNNYSNEEKRALINDIKEVFFADGTVDKIEKKIFETLQKILK
ncbi:hypothetical protein [uncultured Tenacibaculum sp.]|uniref:hypothetical protein n=1 Tax=uncultured Tenacibaculum sp. TaxID=174713 RepID=UPI002629C26D|nr:hypothetical protein [uncultured Tenacibaculum sp.]